MTVMAWAKSTIACFDWDHVRFVNAVLESKLELTECYVVTAFRRIHSIKTFRRQAESYHLTLSYAKQNPFAY